MWQSERLYELSKKVRNEPVDKEKNLGLPFILKVFKLCKRYGIEHEMIKSLSYNDLLALILDFQIDDYKQYLRIQKQQKRDDEVIELSPEQAVAFLKGGVIPKGSD